MSAVDALRAAFQRHAATRPGHRCYPYKQHEYGLFMEAQALGLGWSVETLREAWGDHWINLPDWTWNTYAMAETDHSCSDACAADTASRVVVPD